VSRSCCAALVLCASLSARAQESPVEVPVEEVSAAIEANLRWQSGEVVLGDGLARLNVTPAWRFLGPAEAQRVLVDAWHNPRPHDPPLGMLFAADAPVLGPESWGIVIWFSADGHVADDDAEKIDYAALLGELQKATRDGNSQRTKAGYPAIELVGWAAPPYYDRPSHKLHWARELRFDGEAENTLNYDVRVLGRRGVLVMKAVASMEQVAAVEARMKDALAQVEFAPGHRYEEFDSSVDQVAAYGIAGLVAGGILAKAGFFKLLLAGLLAGKKFVIVGALAAFGAVGKWLRGRRSAPGPG